MLNNKVSTKGIRHQVVTVIVYAFIVITVIINLSFYVLAETISKNSYIEIESQIDQITKAVNEKVNLYNKLLAFMAFNSVVQEYVTDTDDVNFIDLSRQVDNFFNNAKIFSDDILDVIISGKNGNTYGFSRYIREKDNLLYKVITKSENYQYSPIMNIVYNGVEKQCFVVSTDIYSITKNTASRIIGKISIVVDAKSMGIRNYENAGNSTSQIFMLDKNGDIYSYTTDTAEISQQLIKSYANYERHSFKENINGTNYIIINSNNIMNGSKIVCLINEKEVLKDVAKSRNTATICSLICVIIFLFPLTSIIKKIVNPIRKLASFMNEVSEDDIRGLNRKIELQGCKEIVLLAEEFNEMNNRVMTLTTRLINKDKEILMGEIAKKEAQLAFLQSQINPHFLYNTFDSIKGLAALHGVNQIRKMTDDLSEIFRYSVKKDEYVFLYEEISIVQHYIDIQQIRFGDRFIVDYIINEDTKNIIIPKMILQPIIENAFIHGLEGRLTDGKLIIEASKNESFLFIKVEDNGEGLPENILNQITSTLNQNNYSVSNKRHIGISNVHERIKLIHGEKSGIRIKSKIGEGTTVIITLQIND